MLLLGCRPKGRLTEQHDILFGIGNAPKDLISQINAFWPEAKGKIHVDAWRTVTHVDGYKINVFNKEASAPNDHQLFFINLGGYLPNQFDEQHYKVLTVSGNIADAITQAKQTLFYQHNNMPGAPSHIDDKYGVNVDDIYNVKDILPVELKEKYTLQITKEEGLVEDEMHLGYFPLHVLP